MMLGNQLLLFGIVAIVIQNATSQSQPNIIFILTDDQGYYDVGFKGSEVLTPHMDELAAAGVKLENYYVQPMCTPSRSVLLTGRYQIHTGMQHGILKPGMAFGIPLELPLVSNELQRYGYATHLVGKWHLGYPQKEYVPTYRGFDTFYGIYTGHIDHYTKQVDGYDLHFDVGEELSVPWNNSVYSTKTFSQRAVDIIRDHDQEKPLFIYLAFNAPHTPLQVPQEYLDMYSWIEDPSRRTYNAMVTCIDDAVKNVTDALKESDMFDNTIIIYSSDNGGSSGSGSNWPLRGFKGSLYEGGIKSSAFVSSPLLPSPGAVSAELMHISDWFPTLIHLAGGSTEDLEIDGYNQWETIAYEQPSPRKELLHNIDPLTQNHGENLYPDIFDVRVTSALRVGDWKLLTGNNAPPVIGERPPLPPDMIEVGKVGKAGSKQEENRSKRQAEKNIWLYNIADDPSESNDISESNPDIVEQMLYRLAFYNSTAWEAVNYQDYSDPDYDPGNTGGAHYPWL